jgi:hypothetical protein
VFETTISGPSRLPQLFATAAALAAVAVSGSLNFDAAHEIGLAHGPTRAITFGAGALVATAFAAVMPAIALRTFFDRDPVRTVAATVLWVIAVALSVISALGASAAGRADLASARTSDSAVHARVSMDYKRAVADVEAVAPARSASELVPIIASKRNALRGETCTAEASKAVRAICSDLGNLESEAARSTRRVEIEQRLATASSALANLKAPRQADPQANAIAQLASDFGMIVKADDVGRYLGLATALAFEAFAALGLLAAGSRAPAVPVAKATKLPPAEPLTAEQTAPAAPAPLRLVSDYPDVERALIEHVAASGGSLTASQRGLARLIGGTSPATINRTLAAMAAAGTIGMLATRDGTALSLIT